jgi:hypothetical protein
MRRAPQWSIPPSDCRKGQPATKPFIACVLPVALIVVSMMLAGMMEF